MFKPEVKATAVAPVILNSVTTQDVAAVGNVSAHNVARLTYALAGNPPMLCVWVPAANVPVFKRPLLIGTGSVPMRPGFGAKKLYGI
jgi:hypothetical protein